jgi:hypothetical protein
MMPKTKTVNKKMTIKAKQSKATQTPIIKLRTMRGGVVVQGNIKAKRDVIMGDQINDYRKRLMQIATPHQFIAEAEMMQTQIADARKMPMLPPAQQRRLEVIEGDIKEVIEEAKHDKPDPKSIRDTLKSASATMDSVGKAIEAAQGMGKKVDYLARTIDWGGVAAGLSGLASVAMKLFGG